ncbi:MAG: selenocysteine-specific translation elongation factor [Gammaproteobacteria bacterium]|nr:selenocysteine-specific translation elongation factor [Pseudomonadales bacterium]MCP5345481.1 selenocysteine-specific translation elongation factor [Pseudomonadales bacterium]
MNSLPARHSITIATAGHVDHGKTSLVRLITGTDTDTLAEEKNRGLSINSGFAYRRLQHLHHSQQPHDQSDTEADSSRVLSIGFVDVPGHTDFINNALAGIGAADFALLVVAADDGVMPQTREHLAIMDLLGLQGGAIAITKIDKVADERIAQTRREIAELVRDTSFSATPVIALSSQSGVGINSLLMRLESLVNEVVQYPLNRAKLTRFTIDRSFTVKGIGTVVTGTVLAGKIDSTTTLVHSGTGLEARIRGIRHDNLSVSGASAGERIAVNITLPYQQVVRGDWLLDTALYRPTQRLDTRLSLLEPVNFRGGAEYHLYHGTAHHLVRVRQLGDDSSPYFQLFSEQPLLANYGDRFILRDPACERTIGGGTVMDTFVPRRGRNTPARLSFLEAMDRDDDLALRALLDSQPGGVSLDQFLCCRNLDRARGEELVASLQEEALPFARLELEQTGATLLLHDRFLQQAIHHIVAVMADYHQENPSHTGIQESLLSRRANFENSRLLSHAIVGKLVKSGRLRRSGNLLSLPDHQVQRSAEEQLFLERIRPLLEDSGFVPPRTRELADLTAMKLGSLERLLAAARKTGNLIQVAGNRHYLPETIARLAKFTESLAREHRDGFSVIQFRDRLGIGRNLCIEILEYFDRIGYTRRADNVRLLRGSRDKIFSTAEGLSDQNG